MSFNITPVASGYQEIHPYSAMNIDSVKINTSLIMMKECFIMESVQAGKAVFVKESYTALGMEPRTYSFPGRLRTRGFI